jgi:uncharacterized membrane protein YfcA
LAIGAFVGGTIGAEISAHIRERLLRIFLSMSLLIVASRLIFDVIEQ